MRSELPEMMKAAMKGGDKARLGTLRLVSAAMKDREIEARTANRAMDDQDEVAVLRKMVKQRQDSIATYEEHGRAEAAAAERAELEVISAFLPAQLDEAATREVVARAIADVGATGPKDMGKVIAAMRATHAATVDFGKASPIVKAMLTAKAA